jgi:hypothetical protein
MPSCPSGSGRTQPIERDDPTDRQLRMMNVGPELPFMRACAGQA